MRVRGGPKTWVNGVDTGAHQGMDLRVLESMAPREMAADPPHEVVLGDIARYTALRPVLPAVERGDPEAFAHFDEAGWSKVVMNFRLTPEGEGTLLSTETRVLNTDPATRRAFTLYWGLMRAGSGMIRAPRPGPRPVPRRQRLHPVHRRGGSDPGAPDGAGTAPDPARSRPGRQGATARKRSAPGFVGGASRTRFPSGPTRSATGPGEAAAEAARRPSSPTKQPPRSHHS